MRHLEIAERAMRRISESASFLETSTTDIRTLLQNLNKTLIQKGIPLSDKIVKRTKTNNGLKYDVYVFNSPEIITGEAYSNCAKAVRALAAKEKLALNIEVGEDYSQFLIYDYSSNPLADRYSRPAIFQMLIATLNGKRNALLIARNHSDLFSEKNEEFLILNKWLTVPKNWLVYHPQIKRDAAGLKKWFNGAVKADYIKYGGYAFTLDIDFKVTDAKIQFKITV